MSPKNWPTQHELDGLRAAQQDWMPNLIRIDRPFYAGDNEFEIVPEATDIPARITPGFGFWRNVSDQFEGITPFVIAVPWDTDVHAADVVVDAYSRRFQVRAVRAPSTWQTAKQVLTELVTDG